MTETTTRPMWKTALGALVPAGKLLYRLARDPRVPGRTRTIALGALVYAAIPIDLIPDRIPVLGKLDDLGLVAYAIVRLVEEAGPGVVAELWDGDEAGLEAFRGAIETIGSLIPKRVRRVAGLLER